MGVKQKLVVLLRKLHLLEYADYGKYIFSAARHYASNCDFGKSYPDIALPPSFILYESFGKLSYHSYYVNGRESASHIVRLIEKHRDLTAAKICEWGCGPARILRHFPEILEGKGAEFYGSDYNTLTIDWCRATFPDITFSNNRLTPPLPYESDFFDVLYCISVFTHLSMENQTLWLEECLRVLKPGGLFLLSVHGDACISGLFIGEKTLYESEGCVVRDCVTEGKRTYTAYNSPEFMREQFLKNLDIVEFIEGQNGAQDIWIVRKS